MKLCLRKKKLTMTNFKGIYKSFNDKKNYKDLRKVSRIKKKTKDLRVCIYNMLCYKG